MADNGTEKAQQEVAGPQIELSAEKEAEYERITRNLAEMTSGDVLRKVLSEGRTVKCYWGKLSESLNLWSRADGCRNCYYWTTYAGPMACALELTLQLISPTAYHC